MTAESSQVNSVCALTSDWRKKMQRSGSSPGGKQDRRGVEHPLAQVGGVVGDRDRMQVDGRSRSPAAPRSWPSTYWRIAPDVVAEVLTAGRLDAGEDDRTVVSHERAKSSFSPSSARVGPSASVAPGALLASLAPSPRSPCRGLADADAGGDPAEDHQAARQAARRGGRPRSRRRWRRRRSARASRSGRGHVARVRDPERLFLGLRRPRSPPAGLVEWFRGAGFDDRDDATSPWSRDARSESRRAPKCAEITAPSTAIAS